MTIWTIRSWLAFAGRVVMFIIRLGAYLLQLGMITLAMLVFEGMTRISKIWTTSRIDGKH